MDGDAGRNPLRHCRPGRNRRQAGPMAQREARMALGRNITGIQSAEIRLGVRQDARCDRPEDPESALEPQGDQADRLSRGLHEGQADIHHAFRRISIGAGQCDGQADLAANRRQRCGPVQGDRPVSARSRLHRRVEVDGVSQVLRQGGLLHRSTGQSSNRDLRSRR